MANVYPFDPPFSQARMVQGPGAAGKPVQGYPVPVGGVDSSGNAVAFSVDSTGALGGGAGIPLSPNNTATATNSAATLTYAATANVQHMLVGDGAIVWSYSGAPTGGGLTIQDGSGNTVFQIDITSAGPGFIPLNVEGQINSALIITLAAGGSGVVGKLNAPGHKTRVAQPAPDFGQLDFSNLQNSGWWGIPGILGL